jgi:SAM-dependent methyltransferase
MTRRYGTGAGPGVITPDGCAVDLYRLLPPGETEADLIVGVVPPQASVLELGAGCGRVTQCLVQRGLSVVAVDESAEMLASIDYTPTVQSTIEDLELDGTFDAVVLGSHLINTPDRSGATALLAACAKHMRDDGVAIVERHAPDWFDHACETTNEAGGNTYGLVDLHREEPGLLSATALYRVGDREWRHAFTTRRVDDAELNRLVTAAGLQVANVLEDSGSWITCRKDHG